MTMFKCVDQRVDTSERRNGWLPAQALLSPGVTTMCTFFRLAADGSVI